MDLESLQALPSRDLLRVYADILTILNNRTVIRSRNAPAGDLAEYLVAIAYHGDLAPASEKSWDVAAVDGRRLQVKRRVIVPGGRGTQTFSPFRSWDFDACVFVLFDAFTYEVTSAVEVPVAPVMDLARPVTHVGATAMRLSTRSPYATQPGAVDVTKQLQVALSVLP